MAKKGRRRPRTPPSDRPLAAGTRPGPPRRAHKEEARRAREAAIKRARRTQALRRGVTFAVVAAAAVGVLYFANRAGGPNPIPDAALAAAKAAGCGEVKTPSASAPGSLHLASGQSYTYDQHPATSGYHDPAPLPGTPHVYSSPVPETNAVHNLEHGYILIYYRPDGSGALPADVVKELTSFANGQDKVIMAPYAQLPDGTAFALAAWNKLWECPPTVTSTQARTMASGFVHAYRSTTNAPEPNGP